MGPLSEGEFLLNSWASAFLEWKGEKVGMDELTGREGGEGSEYRNLLLI